MSIFLDTLPGTIYRNERVIDGWLLAGHHSLNITLRAESQKCYPARLSIRMQPSVSITLDWSM